MLFASGVLFCTLTNMENHHVQAADRYLFAVSTSYPMPAPCYPARSVTSRDPPGAPESGPRVGPPSVGRVHTARDAVAAAAVRRLVAWHLG